MVYNMLLYELCGFVCLVNSIGRLWNTRVEKDNLRCSRIYGQNSPEISKKLNEKKKFIWTVLQFLNMNRMGFVEFWKIIPVFAQ